MAVNIFKKAKAYRKLHPNISFQDAIQKVKGTGAAVSGVKKKTVKRKAVAGVKKCKAVVRGRVGAVKKRVSPKSKLERGKAIIRQIDAHEKKHAQTVGKEAKTLLALEINSLHDKLDALKAQYKKL